MHPDPDMDTKMPPIVDDKGSVEYDTGETLAAIYIDPASEAACRRKFDLYVVPVSVIFLVLSTLDRNNVSLPLSSPTYPLLNFTAGQCASIWLRQGHRPRRWPIRQHQHTIKRMHHPIRSPLGSSRQALGSK